MGGRQALSTETRCRSGWDEQVPSAIAECFLLLVGGWDPTLHTYLTCATEATS